MRFVILQHDSPRGMHWDLMLQAGEVLRAWALGEAPGSSATIAAEALPDHRLAYLDYEGPISGGRGSVARWDQGTYTFERRGPDEIVVHLHGNRLVGRATLTRLSAATEVWTFAWAADSG